MKTAFRDLANIMRVGVYSKLISIVKARVDTQMIHVFSQISCKDFNLMDDVYSKWLLLMLIG